MVKIGDHIKIMDGSAPSWMYSLTMFLSKHGNSDLEKTMKYATLAREGGCIQDVTFKELEALLTGIRLEQEVTDV
jgi:UDP-3-O-acyl-N-acetylglucosamine deacetylase